MVCSESYTHYEKEDKYVYSHINIDAEIIDSREYLKNFMIKYVKPTSTFPAAFRRKTLVKAQFKEMTMMNDTSIYLRALMMGGKTFINKKIVGIYRIHAGNYTSSPQSDFIIKNLEEKRRIYEYLRQNYAFRNLDGWYAKRVGKTVNYFLRNSRDEKGVGDVINWVNENVSYEEYLKYKKRQIESSKVKLYYFNGRPNFGDMINEDILTSIFKLDFKFSTFQNADLCCIGSILDKLLTNSNINDADKKRQRGCETNKPFHVWEPA